MELAHGTYYKDEDTNELIKDNTNLALKLGGYLQAQKPPNLTLKLSDTFDRKKDKLLLKSNMTPSDLQLFFASSDSTVEQSLLDISKQELANYRQFSPTESMWTPLTPIQLSFRQKFALSSTPVVDMGQLAEELAFDDMLDLSTDSEGMSDSSDITMATPSSQQSSLQSASRPCDFDDLYGFAVDYPEGIEDIYPPAHEYSEAPNFESYGNSMATSPLASSPLELTSSPLEPLEAFDCNDAATIEQATFAAINQDPNFAAINPSSSIDTSTTHDIDPKPHLTLEYPTVDVSDTTTFNKLKSHYHTYKGTTIAQNIISTYRQQVHKQDYVTCSHCDKKMDSIHEYILHLEQENLFKNLKYKCPLHKCPFKLIGFNKKIALRQHIVAKHFDKKTNKIKCKDVYEVNLVKQLVFICSCTKVFCRRDSLQRHIKLIHSGKEPTKRKK